MKLFRKIDTQTGLFVEDVLLMDEFMGNNEFIATEVPQGFYWPKWNGTDWVEGGQAPEPVEPEPQAPTMEQMAIALMQTQTELEATTEALDFLLMDGNYRA